VRHVYLAPHLDDAVLSCGGAIHRQAAAGEAVLVLTVFAGDPASDGDLSPFALEQHGYWGDPPRPTALRRAEDLAALARLDAVAWHLGYLDAVYRAADGGTWAYPDLEALFGPIHGQDEVTAPALADDLAGLLDILGHGDEPFPAVYAPLAVGRHVDHQILHGAAWYLVERGYGLAFYEDYPYAADPVAVDSVLSGPGGNALRAEVIPLDVADLEAKVSALGYYRSQLSVLFGGAEFMPVRVWAFAAGNSPDVCLSERIWWPRTGPGPVAEEGGHHA
jgi:LmbE family N-acetylglucosaminyl deacetylase